MSPLQIPTQASDAHVFHRWGTKDTLAIKHSQGEGENVVKIEVYRQDLIDRLIAFVVKLFWVVSESAEPRISGKYLISRKIKVVETTSLETVKDLLIKKVISILEGRKEKSETLNELNEAIDCFARSFSFDPQEIQNPLETSTTQFSVLPVNDSAIQPEVTKTAIVMQQQVNKLPTTQVSVAEPQTFDFTEKTTKKIAKDPSNVAKDVGDQPSKKQTFSRNYDVLVSETEKVKLAFITGTLANESLLKLASLTFLLNKVGNQIQHLHPLRFLMTIFTDNELKANIRVIRKRRCVWNKFCSGLEVSLKEESEKNNITETFIVNFASNIGISAKSIQPFIQQKRWEELINILIEIVPCS